MQCYPYHLHASHIKNEHKEKSYFLDCFEKSSLKKEKINLITKSNLKAKYILSKPQRLHSIYFQGRNAKATM